MSHAAPSPPADPIAALPLQLVQRGAPEARRPGVRRRRGRWVGFAAAALAAGVAGWILRPGPRPDPAPLPASEVGRLPPGTVSAWPAPGTVVALGRLLPRDRILAIAPPFGAGDARIAELPVQEGESVAAGAVLAVMDSAPTLRAALASAEANVAVRAAALEQTRVQVASERANSRAALARAEAAIPVLRRDYERAAELVGRGAATQQVLEQRRLLAEQAVQDAARARADLMRTDAPDPEAQTDVALARRNLEAALAARDQARADLEKAVVRAPVAGTLLTQRARLGERPGTDGIMTFGGTGDMIAEIEVFEDQIPSLRPGAAVSLGAAALPRPLSGRLGRVGTEVLRQTLTDASPAANTDARVVRAVVELDGDSAAVAARLVGLQVTARVAAAPPAEAAR